LVNRHQPGNSGPSEEHRLAACGVALFDPPHEFAADDDRFPRPAGDIPAP
jgi:hypothetical protein